MTKRPPTIDLDKARQARAEALGEGPTVKFGGKRFNLPPELPYSVLEGIVGVQQAPEAEQGAGVIKVCRDLLGEAGYEAFVNADPPPTIPDFEALVEGALAAYDLGEAQAASLQSSRSTTRPQKPTSNGTTA